MPSFMDQINALFPPVNYSSITFDDLEHPRLVGVYTAFWEVSLVVTTSFFCFMLHMIITKSSQEMADYKWYLVHQLTWSYMFDVYLGLWKPVPLWPFFIGYSAGIFSNFSGDIAKTQLICLAVLSIGMGFSVYISLLHRYVQGFPLSASYRLYSNLWFRFSCYIVAFVSLLTVLCIPLLLAPLQSDELNATLTSKYPELVRLFERHPSIFGYDTSMMKGSVGYILIILFILFIVVISIELLYFNSLRILRRNKSSISPAMYVMQHMLFKTLFVQIGIAFFMLILPIATCLILAMFGVKWTSSVSLLAISFLGMHAMADFIVLCCFIKSYREYVKLLFRKLRLKLGYTVTKRSQFAPGPITMTALPDFREQ